MAEFKAGTREQVKNGQAQYVAGDIVSKDAINAVGGHPLEPRQSLKLLVDLNPVELLTRRQYCTLKRMEHFNQQQ